MRESGVLLPISSLPSPYGIGTFGNIAYKFIDFLEKSGQKNWQILPINPTGYGDSPYQSFSVFAGNPYFIDLDLLITEGLIKYDDVEHIKVECNSSYIDYENLFNTRFDVLKKAYYNFNIDNYSDYNDFVKKNEFWLDDYAFYMALKVHFNNLSWLDWSEDIKSRDEFAMLKYKALLNSEINFYIFIQYFFYKQFFSLKNYANKKGIKIIGDLPIYVALDSSDCWGNKDKFLLDKNNLPIKIAGCPPDAMAINGQIWGNPLYRWDVMEDNDFNWWIERVKQLQEIFDIVRIDHFRGFDEYFTIDYGEETAHNGRWVDGPKVRLFNKIKMELGNVNIIAEDLGFYTEGVDRLLEETGYPGMKVLQFAFDPSEISCHNPYEYKENSVVYTGTHDNDTVLGWANNGNQDYVNEAKKFFNVWENEKLPYEFIKLAMKCPSKLCIIPYQDVLNLGSNARINIPSTLGDNWCWRVSEESFNDSVASYLLQLTKDGGR